MKTNAHSFITAVKAALMFAPEKDVRAYLRGVHLLPRHGALIVEATDGHTAARVTLDGVEDGPDVILPRDLCAAITKIKVPRAELDEAELTLTVDGLNVSVSACGVTLTGEALDFRYVEIDRVIPTHGKRDEVGVNAKHLERAGKAAALLANSKFAGAVLSTGTANECITLTVPTSHGQLKAISQPALFLIMPMRL